MDLYKRTVFLALSGSRAYGTFTESSDYDYRGIVIPPMNNYIGILGKFENSVGLEVYKNYPVGLLQTDPRVPGADPSISPDMQLMEITKFVNLALQNNPSVLETIFTEDSDVLIKDPILEPLVKARDKLLSKQVKARFCGYAYSQLDRIKRHKRWLDNPPTHKPERSEFELPNTSLISADQIGAADALIKKEVDAFAIDQTHLPEDVKIELMAGLSRSMRAIWLALNSTQDYPVGDNKKFDSTDDAIYLGCALNKGFSENFIEVILREKRYRTKLREYDQYQHWLLNRNEKRAEIERKFGFDCYCEDAEFLTDNGWKKFDDIDEKVKLATVYLGPYQHRRHFGVEYQYAIEV